jgi:hypothetical protein
MFYPVAGFAAVNVGRVGHDADGSSGDFLGACGNDGGYYWWNGGCYYRYPNGGWIQIQPGYCAY